MSHIISRFNKLLYTISIIHQKIRKAIGQTPSHLHTPHTYQISPTKLSHITIYNITIAANLPLFFAALF